MKLLATLSISALLAIPMTAQSQTDTYHMRHKSTPLQMRPYSATLYTASRNSVNTMRGHELHNAGNDTIRSFDVLPTGTSFIVVEKGKKKNDAKVFSTTLNERKLADFDSKKFGQPLCAVYFPDGRQIAIAADIITKATKKTPASLQRFIYIADSKNLIPTAQLPAPAFDPSAMFISPNAFYLAAVNGSKCIIYNLEDKSVRTTIDLGEKITDLAFSPDNSDMAVLTSDGLLSIYSTRTFDLRKIIDDLGAGIAFDYNLDGKYVAAAVAPDQIAIVNLLNDSDRQFIDLDNPGVTDIEFVSDADNNTILSYSIINGLDAKRMHGLKPYFNRLVSEEADRMMDNWLKMEPGETMEHYRERVSAESRASQRAMFEYEISTKLAEGILNGKSLSIGTYDRANQVLALQFEEMPTLFIPVPENEVSAFSNPADIHLTEVLYGVNPDDSFEIVYAAFINDANGKTYIFDNKERATLDYMKAEDMISIEVLQQQQMEELRLMELRQQIMDEAKQQNIISDHTNISVDSRVVPDYDANGNKILNYEVSFSYDVEPEFSAEEDFGPGKYHVEESGAASSMLKIVKEAFEGDMKKHFKNSRRLNVRLSGAADATPILHGIPYDGSYGEFDEEPVYIQDQLSPISVSSAKPMMENSQLAFVRALGVKDFLEKNVDGYDDISKDYRYEVNVSEGRGSEYRRITVFFTFVDAFANL